MQHDNEGTMYSEKQNGSESDIFWQVLKLNYYNQEMLCA